jgi:hypothetical protein
VINGHGVETGEPLHVISAVHKAAKVRVVFGLQPMAQPAWLRRYMKILGKPTTDEWVLSKNEARQWVCWGFGEMGVRPSHYVIQS